MLRDARELVQQSERLQRSVHSEVNANFDRYFVEPQPPSTTMVCPLMKLPPGEHKNATVLATSSTVPSRWCGVISICIRRNRGSCSRSSVIGVWITPGATALQRMPCAPYWQAMWVVSAVNPPLAAEYGPPRSPPTTAKVEVMLMMADPASMCGSTSRASRNGARNITLRK